MPSNQARANTTVEHDAPDESSELAALQFHGVRYQVKDVSRSAEFYSRHLGFRVGHQQLPAFAALSLGPLDLLLSGPGASGKPSIVRQPAPVKSAESARPANRSSCRKSGSPALVTANGIDEYKRLPESIPSK